MQHGVLSPGTAGRAAGHVPKSPDLTLLNRASPWLTAMSSEAQLPGGSCLDRASPRLLSLPRQAAPRCSSPFVTCRSSTWQFNFKFSLSEDTYVQDSINLLMHSEIQFGKHNNEGVDPYEFAQLIKTSGMVLSNEITWVAFHSCYDFAYILKLLTADNLPACQVDFFELLQISFPAIHDLKCLMKDCRNLRGGLQGLAEQLQVEGVGPQHQAGSDSLLKGMAFLKM